MSKQLITNYPRKNTDWKYINYLENYIKELKEENKQIKESRRGLIKENNILKNKIQYYKTLENKIQYYKQSLL